MNTRVELVLRWIARRWAIPLLKRLRQPALIKAIQGIRTTMGVQRPAPQGVYARTQQWFEAESSKHPGSRFLKILAESEIVRTAPKSTEKTIHWQFRAGLTRPAPGVFLATIPQAHVTGIAGHVIAPSNHLLGDVSREWFMEPQQHPLLYRLALPAARELPGTTATLAVVSGGTYYHWMTDVLPRLEILRRGGVDLEKVDWFIVNDSSAPFLRQTLDQVGIPETKRVFTGKGTHFLCQTLLLPSMPGLPGWTPPWAPEFLRKAFLPCAGSVNRPRRIYVSRQRSKYRKLVNDGSVRTLLIRCGFEETFLEDLSFLDQVRLFASAEAIVALHGAGLTNLAFCQPETKVIEIFSPNYINGCFWGLSSLLGLEYYYLLGEGRRPAEGHDPHHVEENIRIDAGALERVLQMAGINR